MAWQGVRAPWGRNPLLILGLVNESLFGEYFMCIEKCRLGILVPMQPPTVA